MNILNKLTIKHLKMNKKRTIVSIIGIILSTALMVGVGLLFSTFREATIQDIKSNRGSYNTLFTNVRNDKLEIIENNSGIDKVYYKQDMGFSIIKENNYDYKEKPYYHLYGVTNEYYEQLELKNGRLPKNDKEVVISDHLISYGGLTLKIGDKLTLNLGDRYVNDIAYLTDRYEDGEILKQFTTEEYEIVGIVKRDKLESYSSPGYSVFTNINKKIDRNYSVYVEYKNPAKSYEIGKKIALTLGYTPIEEGTDNFRGVSYNDTLISLYGVSKYDNIYDSLSGVLIIILSLVAVACIVVIYNSFAISVLERKKQFGLFSSIGATRKQIRKTVIFEAFIVSIIGIPLGILSSYLGIGVVILIMNNLISGVIDINLKLCTYPVFLLIPVIFMIITVFISALIPAFKASKISPIEAIRLNDDIRIKGKKVNSPKLIKKVFGMEGDIAYKNMKRNKKKYRITVISLFISIVLYISFSGFMTYAMSGSEDYLGNHDFDAMFMGKSDNMETLDTISKNEYVDEYLTLEVGHFTTGDTKFDALYTDKFEKFLKDLNIGSEDNMTAIILTDEEFNSYLKEMNKTKVKPVLYSNYSKIIYGQGTRKSYNMSKYKNSLKTIPTIHVNHIFWDDEKYNQDPENYNGDPEFVTDIKNYYVSTKKIFGDTMFCYYEHPVLIMSKTLFKRYGLEKYEDDFEGTILVKATNNTKYDEYIKTLEKDSKLADFNYTNATMSTKQTKNMIFVVKLLVYGFITLVTLIGVTSVFNTINTSISLRRKEFAVLRSVGLTPAGFKKMLLCESLFFGLKSLVYALPVSIGVVYLIAKSMDGLVSLDHLLLPWGSMLFATMGVFIVILISMIYSTKKIKNENILDAIRQENI